MATITISKGLIGKEDINLESAGATPSTFARTKAGGGTQTITKLAPAHLKLEDANSRVSATDVEGAIQEIALDIDNIQVIASNGKGADIASAATAVIPSRHLYFDVTGTTDITAITVDSGAAAGRLVVLQFDGSLTVKKSSTLRLLDDFGAKAGLHIVLLYDGTNWHELARSKDGGIDLHSNEFADSHNEDLADCKALGGGHEHYRQGEPLSGFIGGQNDYGWSAV